MREIEMRMQPTQVSDIHTSKGNQLKWEQDGYWYKADAFGYESLAEVVCSRILLHSNLPRPVNYEPVMITYHGNRYRGCRSRNFKADNEILILEGIHGLNHKLSASLPDESKFRIYISALTQLNIDEHNPLPTTDGRLLRRIVRDARTRNTTARETIAMWDSVRRGEEKYIFPYQDGADVMFNSALVYELAVLKIYAEPLLFQIPKDCKEYTEAKRLLKFLDYFLPMPTEAIGKNSLMREFIGGSCFNV